MEPFGYFRDRQAAYGHTLCCQFARAGTPQAQECAAGIAVCEKPGDLPGYESAHHAQNRATARPNERREISRDRGEILDTVQTGKIGKNAVERRAVRQRVDSFGGEHPKLNSTSQPGGIYAFAAECDHARRKVAGDDTNTALCKMQGVDAGAAIQFKDSLVELEDAV
jgi:hypothetical protein